MKRIVLMVLTCVGIAVAALAQALSPLQVQEFELSNGMKVWLNVDHSQPKVFGAVVVGVVISFICYPIFMRTKDTTRAIFTSLLSVSAI